jgi:integrase
VATPPRVARAELTTWTPAELQTFLESVSDDRLAAAWRTLASTGARRGEVLGAALARPRPRRQAVAG